MKQLNTLTHIERKKIAQKFAIAFSPLSEIESSRYDYEWDCFIIRGQTNVEKNGQISIDTRPMKCYISVSEYGRAKFLHWGDKRGVIYL